MNSKQAKVLLPVITAFSEGKVIQSLSRVDGKWYDITPNDHVAFSLAPEQYRIKPEPRIIYRVEVQKKEGNWVTWFSYDSEASAVEAMCELKNVRMKRNDDYKDCRLAKFVEQL